MGWKTSHTATELNHALKLHTYLSLRHPLTSECSSFLVFLGSFEGEEQASSEQCPETQQQLHHTTVWFATESDQTCLGCEVCCCPPAQEETKLAGSANAASPWVKPNPLQ